MCIFVCIFSIYAEYTLSYIQLVAQCISLKDLFNYSAMIVGEISPLLSSHAEEDISYSSKIAELVSYWILGNACYPHANGCRQVMC